MSEGLRPCPFCGGDAKLDHYAGDRYAGEVTLSFIRCKKCGAITYKYRMSTDYSSDEKAIEAWNRRVE